MSRCSDDRLLRVSSEIPAAGQAVPGVEAVERDGVEEVCGGWWQAAVPEEFLEKWHGVQDRARGGVGGVKVVGLGKVLLAVDPIFTMGWKTKWSKATLELAKAVCELLGQERRAYLLCAVEGYVSGDTDRAHEVYDAIMAAATALPQEVHGSDEASRVRSRIVGHALDHVEVIDHPVVVDALRTLRDRGSALSQFRTANDVVTQALLYAATRSVPLREVEIETPLYRTKAKKFACPIVVISVLRIGNSQSLPALKFLPSALV
jgi:hypothetical protein